MQRNSSKTVIAAALALVCARTAQPANLTGNWRAEFNTQVGRQKYTYALKQEGEKITGKASSVTNDEKRETELKERSLKGDEITFAGTFSFQGNEVRINYKGIVAGDEIKFTRKVGTIATEQFIARRERGESPATAPAEPRPRRSQAPIVLGPDDKPAFPDPPAGFDVEREAIAHGRTQMIEYHSMTVGTKRKMLVYTPPGYSTASKYPVVYLLHGIGGDETEWRNNLYYFCQRLFR